jgi:hypothetical protein
MRRSLGTPARDTAYATWYFRGTAHELAMFALVERLIRDPETETVTS